MSTGCAFMIYGPSGEFFFFLRENSGLRYLFGRNGGESDSSIVCQ